MATCGSRAAGAGANPAYSRRVKLLLVALVGLAACGSGSATPSPVAAAGSGSGSADLSKLAPTAAYSVLCAVCHATAMQGGAADHAPSLVSPTFLDTASDEFLRRSIAYGRPGTSMAAYSKELGGPLDDAAIAGLIALVRSKGGPVKELTPLAPTGDVTHGAALYQKNCQSCHGDTVARGQAIHLANPRFLEIATDPFIRFAIENGRPDTKMIAWKTVAVRAGHRRRGRVHPQLQRQDAGAAGAVAGADRRRAARPQPERRRRRSSS